VHAAWTSVLLCHPHDTLCGCSTDEVARAMDARLDEAHTQGAGIRDDAILDLIGHDRDKARQRRADWKPMAVVRNAAPRARGGVAVIRLTSFLSDVKVGANASPGPVETAPPVAPALGGVHHLQVLSKSMAHERTEAPGHYPDNDIVQVTEVAAWVPEIPAYGVTCFPHQQRARKREIPNPVTESGGVISNGLVSVEFRSADLTITDPRTGRSFFEGIEWESLVDAGDLYTQSLRGEKLVAKLRGVKVTSRGPLRAALESRWTLAAGRDRIDVIVLLIVDANTPYVRIRVAGSNSVTDHRLRLGFRTDVEGAGVIADAMFGPVSRTPIVVSKTDAAFELPPVTAPLHRYVSLFAGRRGATLYSDGLGEYEVTDNGTIFVTLVRAVSELSRNDMPERPGHAGWPTHTPEAQCLGPFGAEFALLLHDGDSSATRDLIERTADDVLLPLTGASLRSALSLPKPVDGVALEGTGLACSSIKVSEEHDRLVLRCVNVTTESQRGAWTLPFPVHEARLARLDETPGEQLPVEGRRVPFTAPPRAVVTVIVR
jgi:alpha-mannosidase